ncbi:PREDICTED: protein EDS1-like [Tarenaya hassleriana]|uniref:protein EDS1-like n=1 Tax=Tarenaya hassleriana TaxID=28532 RepID=UPI00053C36DF|nr:PREDICTED: protein EDS1-like [Tarenaya hassleriana]
MEFGAVTGISPLLIGKALTAAIRARDFRGANHYYESAGPYAFFSFPPSFSVDNWFAPGNDAPFGEIKIKRGQLRCLRSIGNDHDATVNEAFLKKAETVLSQSPSFQQQVKRAKEQGKQLVFTGLSSGGATAILVTVWFLETYGPTSPPPRCVTFGAPLVGDAVFKHALGRENWSQYFLHFVKRYDIVPRILFAPKSSSIGDDSLPLFLHLLDPKSEASNPGNDQRIEDFYTTVIRSTSCVANHSACQLMGNTNPLLETFSSFIELSPYRPFGTYVFCSGETPLAVNNADAILQILFYSSQLSEQREWSSVLFQSIKDHHKYEKLPEFLGTNLYHLDQLRLSSDGGDFHANSISAALSISGRLCVLAAIEAENQRYENQKKVQKKQGEIESKLDWMEKYKTKCEAPRTGYFDSFKASNEDLDFEANVKRAQLAGIFDEVLGLLKIYQLPDSFEECKEWINLATKYRRLVEPLDIANYYRHLKNEDTGAYMDNGRPNRYKYAQRWFEHGRWKQGSDLENIFSTKVKALNLGSEQDIKEKLKFAGSKCGSCVWAEVEELRREPYENLKGKPYQEFWERVRALETMIDTWIDERELDTQMFLEGSTFHTWWTTLTQDHTTLSPVSRFMRG